jgi:hypothetical protein
METQNLPCKLTDEELNSKRDQAARLVLESEVIEQQRKDEASRLKGELDTRKTAISRLATEIQERKENRPVEVRREKDTVRGVEETIRCDTGEVVGFRTLSPAERQIILPGINQ